MTSRDKWFVFGIIIVSILAIYSPKLAGLFVILLATYLAIRAGQMGLLGGNQ